MSELKKCLKCGGKATSYTKEKTHEIFKEHGYEVTIFCEDCGAKVVKWCDMQGLAWGAAEEIWNNRKLVEDVLKRLVERRDGYVRQYSTTLSPCSKASYEAYDEAVDIVKEVMG